MFYYNISFLIFLIHSELISKNFCFYFRINILCSFFIFISGFTPQLYTGIAGQHPEGIEMIRVTVEFKMLLLYYIFYFICFLFFVYFTILCIYLLFLKPLAKSGSCRFIAMCVCVVCLCARLRLCVNTQYPNSHFRIIYNIYLHCILTYIRSHTYIIHAFLSESCKNAMAPGGHPRPWHSVYTIVRPYRLFPFHPTAIYPFRSFLGAHTNIVQFFVDFIRRALRINGMRKLCQVQRFCFRACLISFRPDSGDIVTLLEIWYRRSRTSLN